MRLLLITGKGGVGKTSVAAASALHAADRGLSTLVVSTDPAHSLADSLALALGADPTPIGARLDAAQIDASVRLEESWEQIRAYLVTLLQWGGLGAVEAEELAMLPGLEELLALADLHRLIETTRYDLLVVDCAPTAETLRLLTLPEALGWYIERVVPMERRVARAVRPVLGRLTTMPLPPDPLFASVERLYATLQRLRDVLLDARRTTVRLVTNAERIVIAETRRTFTALQLFGYHVDAVVVNRVLPDTIDDPWFDQWKRRQAEHLRSVEEGFAGVPLLRAPLFDDELVGPEALRRLGEELYAEQKVEEVMTGVQPLCIEAEDGEYILRMEVGFAGRDEVEVFQRHDELYVKIGPHTRNLVLPEALRRRQVTAASLRDGSLEVRFARSA